MPAFWGHNLFLQISLRIKLFDSWKLKKKNHLTITKLPDILLSPWTHLWKDKKVGRKAAKTGKRLSNWMQSLHFTTSLLILSPKQSIPVKLCALCHFRGLSEVCQTTSIFFQPFWDQKTKHWFKWDLWKLKIRLYVHFFNNFL